MQNNTIDHHKVQDGLDFILNHFQEPIFSRKIMTKQLGYQVEVFNKQEALEHFKDSNYEDCRINAYPSFTDYHGINRTPISFLMVDLDLKDFSDEKKKGKAVLDTALNKTLRKITESVGGKPTVLWTGNGYHIYQPVSGFILEEYETFYEFTKYFDKDLTSTFIQFAEERFTDNAADRLHNPTVKSCLVRIPGSLNSKCVSRREDAEVKIIQKWDSTRPSMQPLLIPFKTWLTQKRIDEELKNAKFQMTVSKNQERTNTIKWIEKGILEHPLSDHRKYIIWRILSPYLLNVKKLPKEEAYSVMKEWLDKCDKLEKLSFNPKIKIKDGLRGASKGYFPISMEKLKEENRQLYDLVLNRIGNNNL
ncbi:MAG: DNA primase noncatalytic subunit PriX [Nitrososphaeraceae archaeon]